ncbi:MAG: hypothetical protein ACYDD4_09620 [Acidimicrobiales bacterium]
MATEWCGARQRMAQPAPLAVPMVTFGPGIAVAMAGDVERTTESRLAFDLR